MRPRCLMPALVLALGGCSAGPAVPWTLAGASAGAALGKGRSVSSAGGALVGGAVGAWGGYSVSRAYQKGVEDGYLLGSSDEVKRLYWAKQAQERGAGETTGMALLRAVLEESAKQEATP